MLATSPWLEVPRPRPQASRRLICFPHAGAGSGPYRTWLPEVGEDCEVAIVTLPGRDRRGREQPLTQMRDFLDDAVPAIWPSLDLPFAFLGHSMGAVLAFETTRELQRRRGPQPFRLFLSGRAGEPEAGPAIHGLSDEEFLRVLDQRYGGIPRELRSEPELLRMFVPTLRADLKLLETHQVNAGPPLECPITALGGLEDRLTSPAGLESWRQHTAASLEVLTHPGGHFFLLEHQQAVLAQLRARLQPCSDRAAPVARSTPRGLVFPGQGSQRKGMGRELFERFPDYVRQADEVLGYSLVELCLQDSGNRLRKTQYTQPALFVVNALSFLDLGWEADYLAGHSLGEYNALWAAGCFDFATGLRLVQKRGELMAQATGGGMLAVMGLGATGLTALLERHAPEVDLANDNSPEQLVLSGPSAALEALTPHLEMAGARAVRLNVSAAFHSRHMACAATEFAGFLEQCAIGDPQRPVLSNVSGQPYRPGTVPQLLAEQIRQPVQWTQIMRFLLSQGVRELHEAGPAGVLSRLWSVTREAFDQGKLTSLAAEPSPTLTVAPTVATPEAVSPSAEVARGAGERLGSAEFRARYRLRLAYIAGTSGGVASVQAAVRLGQSGLLGVVGSAGQTPEQQKQRLALARKELPSDALLASGLAHTPDNPGLELAMARAVVQGGGDLLEVNGFLSSAPALLAFRFGGCAARGCPRPVLARVARPDVAAELLLPPSSDSLQACLAEGDLCAADVEAAARWPVVSELCADPEAGGLSGSGSWIVLLAAFKEVAAEARQRHGYAQTVPVGACGGLGSPDALAAAFLLGADFVMTTCINGCSPQSQLCPGARDLLAGVAVGDTGYAPAWETFELGGRLEVVRKGSLFAARAGKLQDLYRLYDSLDSLVDRELRWLEKHLLKSSVSEAWTAACQDLAVLFPQALAAAAESARLKMSLLFKWYLWRSSRASELGASSPSEFSIACDSSMAATNRWLRGTNMQSWGERHVEILAERLMQESATCLLRNSISFQTT